jgi:hypothetical protein
VSFRKKFRLRGNQNLELRADVFNVFNRVNFGNPETTVTDSDFGEIASAKIPRQTQLSLRFQF